MRAEINNVDIPIIEAILQKFSARNIYFENVDKEERPNAVTLQAMKEVEQLRKDKNRKRFTNVDDLMAYLND
ncbi:antitoxin [Capnocytophaga haemolytica]|nr:antitoxin [Capnocytophaga haemolytica]